MRTVDDVRKWTETRIKHLDDRDYGERRALDGLLEALGPAAPDPWEAIADGLAKALERSNSQEELRPTARAALAAYRAAKGGPE
mgnify:CR=1 FL=1